MLNTISCLGSYVYQHHRDQYSQHMKTYFWSYYLLFVFICEHLLFLVQ